MFHLLPLSYSVLHSPPRDKEIGELKTGHTDCLLFSQSELVMLGTKVATFRYSADGLVSVGAVTVLRPPIHHRQRPPLQATILQRGRYHVGLISKGRRRHKPPEPYIYNKRRNDLPLPTTQSSTGTEESTHYQSIPFKSNYPEYPDSCLPLSFPHPTHFKIRPSDLPIIPRGFFFYLKAILPQEAPPSTEPLPEPYAFPTPCIYKSRAEKSEDFPALVG